MSSKNVTNDCDFIHVLQNPNNPLLPGDIVTICPGTYRQVTFRLDSTVVKRDPSSQGVITIKATDPNNPTKRPRIQPVSTDHVCELAGVSYIVLDGLILDGSNGTPQRVSNDALKLSGGSTQNIIQNCELAFSCSQGILTADGSDHNKFLNLYIHDNGTAGATGGPGEQHGFYLTSSYNVIDHCEIFNNLAYGIHAYTAKLSDYVTHNIIRNCSVHHNGKAGILLLSDTTGSSAPPAENSAHNVMYNNVVHNNPQGGIWIGGTSGTCGITTDNQVYNNTIFHNGDQTGSGVTGIYVDPNSTSIDVQNNISYQNLPTNYNPNPNIDRSKNWPEGCAPPFVDITNPDAPDLHLTSHTSPQGSHLGNITSDADGGCRPSGTYDMGAYEFGSTPNQCATYL